MALPPQHLGMVESMWGDRGKHGIIVLVTCGSAIPFRNHAAPSCRGNRCYTTSLELASPCVQGYDTCIGQGPSRLCNGPILPPSTWVDLQDTSHTYSTSMAMYISIFWGSAPSPGHAPCWGAMQRWTQAHRKASQGNSMVAEAKPPKEDPRPAQELSEIIGTWDNVFSLGTLYRPPPELGGRQCQSLVKVLVKFCICHLHILGSSPAPLWLQDALVIIPGRVQRHVQA